MSVNEMQAEKLDLIAWISQLQDISLIKKLKAFQAENMEIPETHKQEVRNRIKNTDPTEYRSMDEENGLVRVEAIFHMSENPEGWQERTQ